MEEIWKPVVGFEGYYAVSNLWRIASLFFKNNLVNKADFRIRDISPWTNGYVLVYMQWKHYYLHRVVACAFIPNIDNKPQINHKNFNRSDNRVENLEWCSSKENNMHSHKMNKNRKYSNYFKWKFWKDHVASKPILQFSREWEFIMEWQSLADIQRDINICRSGISDCCRGNRKTAWWYVWKYAN